MKDSRHVFRKILDYIRKIQVYVKGVDYKSFITNEEKIFACAFAVCQISELTQQISDAERKRYTAIPWPAIRALRNHIVHNYDKIDMQILWNTITVDLYELAAEIEKIQKNTPKNV